MEASRTFVGTVVCVDLVGYSKRSVAQQSEIKQAFNKLLMQVLKKVPPEDRIILDTGDGAAISFLGDPEESLAIGLKLRDAMNAAATRLGAGPSDAGPVRIGINLGPVRLAADMNGHPKIIGDGINVAEKICSFASPGQVVVSRPFHDMVSRISDRHREIFNYEGVRTDKNVRDHEIYSVKPVASEVPPEKKTKTLPPVPPPAPAAEAAAPDKPASEGAIVTLLRNRAAVTGAAIVLLGIIAYEISVIVHRTASVDAVATAPAPSDIKPPVVTKAPEPIKPAPPVEKIEPPKPEARKVEPPKVEPAKVEPKKAEPPKIEAPKVEPKKIEPPPKVEAPKPEPKKAEPAKKTESPRVEPKRIEEPPRVIPPLRTPPPQVAPPPSTSPSMQPTEPTPAMREEPKPAPPPAPAPTTVANPITRTPVAFPLAAVNRGISYGVVRAKLTINAAGAVTDVVVISADPPRIFDRAAITALETWKFNTGADKRTYDVEIEFKR